MSIIAFIPAREFVFSTFKSSPLMLEVPAIAPPQKTVNNTRIIPNKNTLFNQTPQFL